MNYSELLPHIDVAEGSSRVMNNIKLYMKLLGKFQGRKMVDELQLAITTANHEEVAQSAHAIRGTAANLSFPTLLQITSEIESLAKENKDCSHLMEQLTVAINGLEDAIAKLSS